MNRIELLTMIRSARQCSLKEANAELTEALQQEVFTCRCGEVKAGTRKDCDACWRFNKKENVAHGY